MSKEFQCKRKVSGLGGAGWKWLAGSWSDTCAALARSFRSTRGPPSPPQLLSHRTPPRAGPGSADTPRMAEGCPRASRAEHAAALTPGDGTSPAVVTNTAAFPGTPSHDRGYRHNDAPCPRHTPSPPRRRLGQISSAFSPFPAYLH